MKIQITSDKLTDLGADLIAFIMPSAETDSRFEALDKASGGRLSERLKEESFSGAADQLVAVDTRDRLGSKWVVFIGCDLDDPAGIREAAGQAASCAKRHKAATVAVVLPSSSEVERGVYLASLGLHLGQYQFDRYKADKDSSKGKGKGKAEKAKGAHKIKRVKLVPTRGKKIKPATAKALGRQVTRATATAKAVCRARDLVNEPASYMTPTRIAEIAKEIADGHKDLKIKVLDRKACEKLGMGMYLAVAQGAHEEPKFIHMTYTPTKRTKGSKRIALIGKGVMFDSGGYSIKPSASMVDMKMDMAGSAAVISAMEAIAALGIGHEVHAIAACCENMVSGNAYKLGDVLTSMDGTTVEINNTDAEGRLTLGDAISYARKKIKPDEIIDFATLTGACMVALGNHTAAVFSEDDELAGRWLEAAHRTGELAWRLPLEKRLKKQLSSDIAVMRNSGERWGGAITAALFLQHFVKDSTWLHVDIAGPAFASSGSPAVAKGGTGYAVASIVDYLHH